MQKNDKVFGVVVSAVVLVVLMVFFVDTKIDEAIARRSVSSKANVVCNLVAGKVVSLADFVVAFSVDDSSKRKAAIECVAEYLEVSSEDIRTVVESGEFSYAISQDKIPAKLRSKILPASFGSAIVE
jgi:hypothetical protein